MATDVDKLLFQLLALEQHELDSRHVFTHMLRMSNCSRRKMPIHRCLELFDIYPTVLVHVKLLNQLLRLRGSHSQVAVFRYGDTFPSSMLKPRIRSGTPSLPSLSEGKRVD